MNRIFRVCLVASLMLGSTVVGAQDSALEQRIRELSGRIETLLEGQESQRKQIAELSREIDALREKQNRPQPEYASQEDLRRLTDAVREIDRKRLDDYERIREELRKLGRTIRDTVAAPPPSRNAPTPAKDTPEPAIEKGFEYVVQPGDSLSTIVKAYRDKNIKVTIDQVLKANPGLKADRVFVGKKIFIPAP